MNKIELKVFLMLVVLYLEEQEKDPEIAFPVLLAFSDGTDHVFAEFSWGREKSEDIFGIGHRSLDFSEIRLPITLATKDQNGREGTIEITQAIIDVCIAGLKKAIQ